MSAYRRRRSELTVGFFAFGAVAVFVLMFGSLTSRGVLSRHSDLFVTLPSAEGLLKGDAVLYRGVRVGEVKQIGFHQDGSVVVRARLNRALPLTRGAQAVLTPVDMFGRQSMVLRDGARAGPALADGDTLAGERPRPMTDRIDHLGSQVERLLGDSTVSLLQDALAGVGSAGSGVSTLGGEAARFLATQEQALAQLAQAVTVVADNLATATDSAEIALLRTELQVAIGNLAAAGARVDSASSAIASVFAKIEHGDGSLALLLNDDALYRRAEGAVSELEALIADVRERPGRYLTVEVF